MNEKQLIKEIKARVGKQSKINFSKQSLTKMPRICRLLEEVKEDRSGHTNTTTISII
jgi:hypothetical protein